MADNENNAAADPVALDRSKGKWFVVRTRVGHERKVKERIDSQVAHADTVVPVYEVMIPMETVSVVRNGKRATRKRMFYPGYVFVRMDLYNGDPCRDNLNNPLWHLIRETQDVTSFVGVNECPQPLSDSEAEDLLRSTEEVAPGSSAPVQIPPYIVIGGTVRIKDGAFANFEGTIEEIDAEHGKLKLMVSIFGRSTPVELEFWQVGPDEE